MISVKEAIIVEGRYDRVKLKEIVDTPIIETGGFRIFKDKEKQNLIRKIAETRGILILTDSDSGGFVIRNFLKGIVPEKSLKHAYVPQLKGKEKRKPASSKEGLLGVEGLSAEIILNAIKSGGATVLNEDSPESKSEIEKIHLYELGLTGRENSAVLREKLLKKLGLPTYLSTNAMLSALNCLYSLNELKTIVNEIK
jgi:Small primase-like proteins (Toprim domain)